MYVKYFSIHVIYLCVVGSPQLGSDGKRFEGGIGMDRFSISFWIFEIFISLEFLSSLVLLEIG